MNLGTQLNSKLNPKPVQSPAPVKPAEPVQQTPTTINQDLTNLKTRYADALNSIKHKDKQGANKPK